MAVYENAKPLDSTVSNFLYTTGIKNTTQVRALSYLTVNLKSSGLYDKMLAIWPIIGGTDITSKYNLKNPADTNAAYRLTFSGGWTYNSSGITPNGTTAYANTYIAANNAFLSLNSISLWYYSTSTPTVGYQDLMGANNGSFTTGARISTQAGTTTNDNLNGNEIAFQNNTKTGLIGVSRTGSASFTRYSRGVGETQNNASIAAQSFNIYLGALNYGGSPLEYTQCGCAYAAIGLGLTSAEALTVNNIVQQYQIILGRNVY